MLQIFQVGIPAGIQSTVINISNAMLQSSVNSFGSIAMAGYTAANNILGFLYVSVNSITQACMSFTSQNYAVGKQKRMDRVLIDCLFLTTAVALVMGSASYLFGTQILGIYTSNSEVIKSGLEIISITTIPYFLCGIMDLFRSTKRNGILNSTYDTFYNRNSRSQNHLDIWSVSKPQVAVFPVYIISRFMDSDNHHAGYLLYVCQK